MKYYIRKQSKSSRNASSLRESNEIRVIRCMNCSCRQLDSKNHTIINDYTESGMHKSAPMSLEEWKIESKNEELRRWRRYENL